MADSNTSQFIRIDLTLIDQQFDKWIREEETLSGVLNIKLTKQRNQDLRQKLDAWRRRINERSRIKKRTLD